MKITVLNGMAYVDDERIPCNFENGILKLYFDQIKDGFIRTQDERFICIQKRENYSVEYEYINENTMVVSGYKPDGKTIYYTKESKSGNHAIKMVFEYPGTNESECGKILETFLDNVSY